MLSTSSRVDVINQLEKQYHQCKQTAGSLYVIHRWPAPYRTILQEYRFQTLPLNLLFPKCNISTVLGTILCVTWEFILHVFTICERTKM